MLLLNVGRGAKFPTHFGKKYVKSIGQICKFEVFMSTNEEF